PEPLVLERDQRVEEARIDRLERHRQPPAIVGREEHVRRIAVAVLDDDRPAGVARRQRDRERERAHHEHPRVDRGDRRDRPAPGANHSVVAVPGPPMTATLPLTFWVRAHKVPSYIASASTGGTANLPLVTARTVYTTFFACFGASAPNASR